MRGKPAWFWPNGAVAISAIRSEFSTTPDLSGRDESHSLIGPAVRSRRFRTSESASDPRRQRTGGAGFKTGRART